MADEDQVDRIAELEGEVERLREELAKRDRRQKRLALGTLGVGGRLLLGKDLRSSFRDWLTAKSLRDPLPSEETAEVLAAVVKRIVRVGFVGFVLALLPGAFLVWQNLLIRSQIKLQADQVDQQATMIRQQANQIALQATHTLIVRRAQLLATIYDEDCEDVPGVGHEPIAKAPERKCQPRANARARQEAAHAFVEIGRDDDGRANLTGANLSGLSFSKARFDAVVLWKSDLSNTYLADADLNDAFLNEANLSSADLSNAKLDGAILRGANLCGANLSNANLSGAYLFRANLRDAKLGGADLRGANLRGAFNVGDARNLRQEQVDSAEGDANTRLPPGLTYPAHWLKATEPEPSGNTESNSE